MKVNIPYNYIEYTDSLKKVNHSYLDIFGKKFTLLGKYDSKNTINTRKLILNKPYLLFKLYKEEKKIYEYKEYKITKDDAYKEALHRSEKQIKNRLKSDEYIISKNTLKKDAFRSKMYVEVFFKVYENIGVTSDIGELNENEAYKEALKRSENKIKSKLNDNEYIISKKVLKKEVFRSKMNIEVFFKVYENIGVTSNIVEKDDLNGVSN